MSGGQFRRGRGAATRELIDKIEAAGGRVTFTKRGHLRVTGPVGVAFVSSAWANQRDLQNAVADIARYAGLAITV